ncbi:unnamed protein product [Polarella glacialis]|uniref:Uncharacterized protein n=1 Tax=Polarella glacialis TaxID=89957 RepID=A0A813LN95_POLGL|nr:unnamed protein product [Polarella glacialis]CAE8615248.1 unnamed protein product [Polarella glacialis]CAE8734062.1 unnamed protein product [Polarella glacialis]
MQVLAEVMEQPIVAEAELPMQSVVTGSCTEVRQTAEVGQLLAGAVHTGLGLDTAERELVRQQGLEFASCLIKGGDSLQVLAEMKPLARQPDVSTGPGSKASKSSAQQRDHAVVQLLVEEKRPESHIDAAEHRLTLAQSSQLVDQEQGPLSD